MGQDIPDEVPSLEELGSDDELPPYWMEETTITCARWVKHDLDKHRNGTPWTPFLEQLRQEYADPLTLNDAEEIAEEVKRQVGDSDLDEGELALATADYLMTEYDLPGKVAEELEARQ